MDELTPEPGAGGEGPPPAVPTESVDPPAVRIATPPEPAGRRRVGRGVAAVIAVVGLLTIGGVGVLGYSLNQDLTATRADLATTETDLGSTTATLGDTSTNLETTSTTLTAAKSERSGLDAEIAGLSAQVEQQTACVKLQTAALAELGRISDLLTDNFNRTTENSAWDAAEKKRAKAVTAALDAYYQAYSKAFDGAKSTARTWANKGAASVAVIAAQAKLQAAEFALIDTKSAEIEKAVNELADDLTAAETTCEEVAP